MIQFKEIVFIRTKSQGKNAGLKIEEVQNAIKKLVDWSFKMNRHEIMEVYMNYENKAIYNNGIIVRKLYNGQY